MENVGWLKFVELRILGQESNLPWFLLDKLRCHEFARSRGIPTAELLKVFSSPLDISFDGLPDRFVIKSNLESSTRSVMLLERRGLEFFDLLHHEFVSQEAIVSLQLGFFESIKNEDKCVLVEGLLAGDVSGPIPLDYKAYSFNGRVALILQIDRNTSPSSVVWYDEECRPIEEGRINLSAKYVQRGVPKNAEFISTMRSLACHVSREIVTPFVSVDMYSTPNGPVLGEFTLTPGGLYYGVHFKLSDAENERLGRYWIQAAEELSSAKDIIDFG